MGQPDILWVRQYNFCPCSHLCCLEKLLKAPSGVLYHCGGHAALGKQTHCLMETQGVCSGTISG